VDDTAQLGEVMKWDGQQDGVLGPLRY
jgi:hypothetical protein